MGNISVAFGKVTISAPTYSDIEVLVATHRVINEKAWNPTTIEGSPSEADCITTEEGLVSVTLPFTACGNFIYKATVMTCNVPGKGVSTELLTDEDLGDYSESYLKELEGVYDQELALATSITGKVL